MGPPLPEPENPALTAYAAQERSGLRDDAGQGDAPENAPTGRGTDFGTGRRTDLHPQEQHNGRTSQPQRCARVRDYAVVKDLLVPTSNHFEPAPTKREAGAQRPPQRFQILPAMSGPVPALQNARGGQADGFEAGS